jgi:hypothetical protein
MAINKFRGTSRVERIQNIRSSQNIYAKGNQGNFPGLTTYANRVASSTISNKAYTSSFAPTSSYYQTSSLTVDSLELLGGTATGSVATDIFTNISSSFPIEQISSSLMNAGLWLISIYSGSAIKTSEFVAVWGSSSINYYSTEVSQIGQVPVNLSASNVSGSVSIIVNPSSGVWTVKLIKITI